MLSTAVHGAAPLPPLAAYSFGADPRSAIPPQQLPALQLPATRTRTAGDPTRHASLNNPVSEGNRQYLAQRLGIQPSALSSAARPVGQRATVGKLNKKKMASTKGVIERSARRDLHATPPIGPKDVAAGLFSLVNRGLVAAHVDLTPALARHPAPVLQAPSRMHPHKDQFGPHSSCAYISPFGFNLSNTKLDLLSGLQPDPTSAPNPPQTRVNVRVSRCRHNPRGHENSAGGHRCSTHAEDVATSFDGLAGRTVARRRRCSQRCDTAA